MGRKKKEIARKEKRKRQHGGKIGNVQNNRKKGEN